MKYQWNYKILKNLQPNAHRSDTAGTPTDRRMDALRWTAGDRGVHTLLEDSHRWFPGAATISAGTPAACQMEILPFGDNSGQSPNSLLTAIVRWTLGELSESFKVKKNGGTPNSELQVEHSWKRPEICRAPTKSSSIGTLA